MSNCLQNLYYIWDHDTSQTRVTDQSPTRARPGRVRDVRAAGIGGGRVRYVHLQGQVSVAVTGSATAARRSLDHAAQSPSRTHTIYAYFPSQSTSEMHN